MFYLDSVYDLIDYHLRECVKREVKLCRCENCGKYFYFTGRISVEYCNRIFDEKSGTCKDVGAVKTWAASKSGDKVFGVYRREYKKRFAWIKAGRLTQEDFYTWSEKAREKKAECNSGKITLEEFSEWLGQS